MLGVIGATKDVRSNFRLLAYTSKNRLSDKTPVKSRIAKAGEYEYYWFSSNISVSNPQA